jgi:nicotinate-nucleotide pyrophosphorylase (carboxylating)
VIGVLHPDAERLIEAALAEDVGEGDWTTLWTVPEERRAEAVVIAKQAGVIAGTAVAEAVFARLDAAAEVQIDAPDGSAVRVGDVVLRVEGAARALLTGERTALNLLQRLSGVATLTRAFVDAVRGTGARVVDTRKTTPGMRGLEKAAVLAGGGANHRFGLYDMVLIKDNHVAAAGGIRAAVEAVRAHDHSGLRVEVETTSLSEVEEALGLGVDRILFDNMSPELLRSAVERVRAHGTGRPEMEASGGLTLASVRAVAASGVELVSVGALTHSAPALDLSMRLRTS